MSDKPLIIAFPGMGADERLLMPQQSMPVEIQVPPRLEPLPRESLTAYAKRIAAQIHPPRPFYLAGISLGGMLALEVARHTSPKGLILISTCRSCRELPWIYRCTGRFSRYIPLAVIRSARLIPSAMRKQFGVVSGPQAALFEEMMAATPPQFIRWAIGALTTWPGAGPLTIPIFHIHGGADRIIPCQRCRPDVILPHAGHLMNMTHAEQVNQAILTWITGVEGNEATLETCPFSPGS